ncbi:hypothetical protein Hanom_Chr09g00800511 [Helianthus anomalus]
MIHRTHPGSFRCSLHKNNNNPQPQQYDDESFEPAQGEVTDNEPFIQSSLPQDLVF